MLLLIVQDGIIKKKYSEYYKNSENREKIAVLGENSMNLGIDFGSTYTIASLYDENNKSLHALLLGGMT